MKAPRTWLVVASYGMMEPKAEEMYNINIEVRSWRKVQCGKLREMNSVNIEDGDSVWGQKKTEMT